MLGPDITVPASGTKLDAVVGTEVLHVERLSEVSFAAGQYAGLLKRLKKHTHFRDKAIKRLMINVSSQILRLQLWEDRTNKFLFQTPCFDRSSFQRPKEV